MAAKKRGRKRKQVERLGHAQTQEQQIQVDNPYYNKAQEGEPGNDRTIKATINMRESTPAYWFYRGIIDAAQYEAAKEFRRLWEATGGKGAGSFDYSKPKVDGGTMADPISIRQMDATLKLKEIHNLIGPKAYELVLKVCAQSIWVKDLSNSRAERDYLSEQCKEMLTRIAEYWGYKDRKISAYRHTA